MIYVRCNQSPTRKSSERKKNKRNRDHFWERSAIGPESQFAIFLVFGHGKLNGNVAFHSSTQKLKWKILPRSCEKHFTSIEHSCTCELRFKKCKSALCLVQILTQNSYKKKKKKKKKSYSLQLHLNANEPVAFDFQRISYRTPVTLKTKTTNLERSIVTLSLSILDIVYTPTVLLACATEKRQREKKTNNSASYWPSGAVRQAGRKEGILRILIRVTHKGRSRVYICVYVSVSVNVWEYTVSQVRLG